MQFRELSVQALALQPPLELFVFGQLQLALQIHHFGTLVHAKSRGATAVHQPQRTLLGRFANLVAVLAHFPAQVVMGMAVLFIECIQPPLTSGAGFANDWNLQLS